MCMSLTEIFQSVFTALARPLTLVGLTLVRLTLVMLNLVILQIKIWVGE